MNILHKASSLRPEFEDAIISYALQTMTSLKNVQYEHFIKDSTAPHDVLDAIIQLGKIFFDTMIDDLIENLYAKIELGMHALEGKTILHTAPHHDDILLGYHGYAVRTLCKNKNYIAYITNGTRGVTDHYVQGMLESMLNYNQYKLQKLFDYTYNDLLQTFAAAFHAGDQQAMHQTRLLIFGRILADLSASVDLDQLKAHCFYLLKAVPYVPDVSPKIAAQYDAIKARIRQSESACKWMIVQGHVDNVTHCQSQFYDNPSDDAYHHDVTQFFNYLETIHPDIVTVALDPCGVGPTTHFMSAQVIAQALEKYVRLYDPMRELAVIGYRNVWGASTLATTSMIVPVTGQEIDQMHAIFCSCFATQHDAVVESPVHEGFFSDASRQLQEQHYHDLQILLGEDLNTIMPNAAGLIFLEILTIEQLQARVQFL